MSVCDVCGARVLRALTATGDELLLRPSPSPAGVWLLEGGDPPRARDVEGLPARGRAAPVGDRHNMHRCSTKRPPPTDHGDSERAFTPTIVEGADLASLKPRHPLPQVGDEFVPLWGWGR